jgi:hypothetical protein
MAAGYWAPLAIANADGPTLTAAAAASCLPVSAKYNFPANAFVVGSTYRFKATGRISCAVTTPGTARFDLRYGGTVIFDTGQINLNVVAKTNLPFELEILLTCRAVGPTSNFIGMARFVSEAVIGSPLATAGGVGVILSSVSGGPDTAPAVGSNVDTTSSGAFDCFFTQTVATGSLTVHNCVLESASLATP